MTLDNSEATFEVTWNQQGSALEGTITIEGTACLTAGVVRGTLSGNDIDFGVVQREVEVNYTGTVFGDTMSGTYSTTCDNARGEWEAEKSG